MQNNDQTSEAYRAVERAARDSYGRLIGYLAAHSRDVAAAEDALADAFARIGQLASRRRP
jgi:RNA polymerase sigma-70 factor (ECF subfamily)